jgi:Zn-dependent protease
MFSRRGVRLGRILGVEVTLDASWFVFAALIAWLLSQYFSSRFPVSGAAAALLGVMGAVLFFASVLAHELSHSVVARRKGIPVPRITLFIFGGVAQISREPNTPGDEIRIALAGPALSAVLGLALLALGLAAQAAGAVAGAGLFETVAGVNFLLAVFNLLPGFPLDGGRVFRAIVWRATGNQSKATRVAATGGRVIAAALMALGVALVVFRRDPLNGVWLVVIGLFLHQTAYAAYRRATGPTVGDLMTRQPPWLPPELPIDASLHERLEASPDRAFLVVSPEGRIAGVLTLEALDAIAPERWPSLTARDVMVPMQAAMVADAQEPYDSLVARLSANPAGRFVVLDRGWLVGVVSPHELARRLRGPLVQEG